MKLYIERFKTAEELDDQIFEVLLPTETVSEVKDGKKSTKVRKLYPGYVFIQMRLYDENQQADQQALVLRQGGRRASSALSAASIPPRCASPRSTRSAPASRPPAARKCRRCSTRSARR